MPQMDLDVASTAAERLRQEIATYDFKGITCTASLGVSSISLGAKTMQDLIDEADKCLYAAKRGGRNQVMRWDEVPDAIEIDDSSIARKPAGEETVSSRPAISFQTVSALLSALGSRDTASAEHSRRVADLCVRTAKGLVAISDSFILENAALLHDIGKIGVPDSVLLKPGPLTPEERHIIFSHDQIGVEIVRSTFDCEQMTQIILCHRAHYSGSESRFGLPVGKDILLGARILSICEAYDAMVHDLVYRAAMTSEEAFAELLRCAGQQFDSDLANRFITMMKFEPKPTSNRGMASAWRLSCSWECKSKKWPTPWTKKIASRSYVSLVKSDRRPPQAVVHTSPISQRNWNKPRTNNKLGWIVWKLPSISSNSIEARSAPTYPTRQI